MTTTAPSRGIASAEAKAEPTAPGFTTVFGRELVGELPNFVHRPYLVVTMEDLWPRFEGLFDEHLASVHFVTTLDAAEVEAQAQALPEFGSIVGLGGGQASDVAKYFAWRRGRPIFQVPTAMTTNAPFGHRSVLRDEGKAVVVGWAVPEAVYVDYDVIRSAPPLLNRSGIGDVLCHHTARFDWKLAHDTGHEEARWPYDQRLVDEAQASLESVLADLDEIRAVTDRGIRTLMRAHRWAGSSVHDAGWNTRHLDGVDHCFLYALEDVTGHHFLHGQAVGFGTYFGAVLQDNEPEMILSALERVGVDIRPEAMGITWDDAATAMRGLSRYVREADLEYTIADARPVTEEFIEQVRDRVYATFGAWQS
jgi:glycerol-1-phosphate dehydrogenase [NAD(P)+]